MTSSRRRLPSWRNALASTRASEARGARTDPLGHSSLPTEVSPIMTSLIDASEKSTKQAASDVAQKWVAVARSLAPLVESERQQGDDDTVVTAKLVEAWRDAGLYRLLQPSHHGGEGLDVVSYLKVVEEVSRQDASAGWV